MRSRPRSTTRRANSTSWWPASCHLWRSSPPDEPPPCSRQNWTTHPIGDWRPGFAWTSVIYLGGIIYVGLDAFPEYELVAAGGNFMFADLTSVAGCLYRFSAVADCRARWRPGVSRSTPTSSYRCSTRRAGQGLHGGESGTLSPAVQELFEQTDPRHEARRTACKVPAQCRDTPRPTSASCSSDDIERDEQKSRRQKRMSAGDKRLIPDACISCNTVAGRVNVSVIFRMVCALAICSGVSLPWSRWRSSRAASRAGLSCGMHRQDWQARGGQH